MRAAIITVLMLSCVGTPSSPPAPAGAQPDAVSARAARGAVGRHEERAVDRIRALYKHVNETITRTPSEVRCVKDAGEWMSVPSGAPPEGCDPIVDIYRVGDAIRKAVVFEYSQGGDWASRAEHYFYANGTLAFRFEHLTSFQGHDPDLGPDSPSGPFVVESRTYFDETGNQVRLLRKAMFEPTGKVVPPSVVAQPETTRLDSTAALKTAR